MTLVKITDQDGPFWINPAKVATLRERTPTSCYVTLRRGPDKDEHAELDESMIVELPMDEVAGLLNKLSFGQKAEIAQVVHVTCFNYLRAAERDDMRKQTLQNDLSHGL